MTGNAESSLQIHLTDDSLAANDRERVMGGHLRSVRTTLRPREERTAHCTLHRACGDVQLLDDHYANYPVRRLVDAPYSALLETCGRWCGRSEQQPRPAICSTSIQSSVHPEPGGFKDRLA